MQFLRKFFLIHGTLSENDPQDNSDNKNHKDNNQSECAAACPSGAISMVPAKMPPQQKKHGSVAAAMAELASAKSVQENIARSVAARTQGVEKKLAQAIQRSARLTAEDVCREGGYMLPQSANVHALLKEIALSGDEYAAGIAGRLMQLLPVNDSQV